MACDGEMVIHGMLAGYPLCGFSDETPGRWPHGNGYVPFWEVAKINCPVCRPEAERLEKNQELIRERPSRRA